MNTSDSIYMFWSIISARESLRELKEFMHVVFIGFRHRVLLALSCCKVASEMFGMLIQTSHLQLNLKMLLNIRSIFLVVLNVFRHC